MNSSSDTAVENLPNGNCDNLTSVQARKVSEAARNCVSQAVALRNSAVAASNGNGSEGECPEFDIYKF